MRKEKFLLNFKLLNKMNCTCPNCEMENAYFEILDEKGVHYAYPDCGHEWCDTSITISEENE